MSLRVKAKQHDYLLLLYIFISGVFLMGIFVGNSDRDMIVQLLGGSFAVFLTKIFRVW